MKLKRLCRYGVSERLASYDRSEYDRHAQTTGEPCRALQPHMCLESLGFLPVAFISIKKWKDESVRKSPAINTFARFTHPQCKMLSTRRTSKFQSLQSLSTTTTQWVASTAQTRTCLTIHHYAKGKRFTTRNCFATFLTFPSSMPFAYTRSKVEH